MSFRFEVGMLRLLLTASLVSLAVLCGCVRTPGAPRDDPYETESRTEAMEEEEESEASEDMNL